MKSMKTYLNLSTLCLVTLVLVLVNYQSTPCEARSFHTRTKYRLSKPQPSYNVGYENWKHTGQPITVVSTYNNSRSPAKDKLQKKRDEINDFGDVSQEDTIRQIFDAGFKRLFTLLRKVLVANSPNKNKETEEPNGEPKEPKYKLPGLPSTPIFHSYNLTSLVNFLGATTKDEKEIEFLAETAVVDTVSQLVQIIGLNDLREWLGFILMSFVLGPILIPLVWLPVAAFTMLALLVPLFYYNPPSKLNTNVAGHDPLGPVGENAEARSFESLGKSGTLNSTILNGLPQHQSENISNSTPIGFETCMERVTCLVTSFYRNNPLTQWLSTQVHATKVEWARETYASVTDDVFISRENCEKYHCSLLPNLPTVMSRLMTSWNLSPNEKL